MKLLFALRFMVFNATFYKISFILEWSVLLVEETGVPGENFITPEWDSNSQLSYDHDLHWN
jgi:hypothetical protein